MKRILISILTAVALTSCGGPDYNQEKCETLITEVSSARQMQDVTREQWRGLYDQYMSLDASLRSQITKLLTTPWSAAKEKAINDLIDSKEMTHWRTLTRLLGPLSNSGFSASAYFSESEIADMCAAVETTSLEFANLLGQADLDGK